MHRLRRIARINLFGESTNGICEWRASIEAAPEARFGASIFCRWFIDGDRLGGFGHLNGERRCVWFRRRRYELSGCSGHAQGRMIQSASSAKITLRNRLSELRSLRSPERNRSASSRNPSCLRRRGSDHCQLALAAQLDRHRKALQTRVQR